MNHGCVVLFSPVCPNAVFWSAAWHILRLILDFEAVLYGTVSVSAVFTQLELK